MYADSHCHLDFAAFDCDRSSTLEQCQQQQIQRILIPGTARQAWDKQIQLCNQYAMLDMALGLHPYFLERYQPGDLLKLRQLISQHSPLAIGEIGLDFHLSIPQPLQIEVFREQLDLAEELGLPVILHQRKSHNHVQRQLKLSGFSRGGVIHAFSGSVQQAEDYLSLGFYLGIGGTITYPRANKTIQTLKQISIEHVLLETDAPDMPLAGQQGQRNTPLNIPLIARALAKIKQMDEHELARACWLNYQRLFFS